MPSTAGAEPAAQVAMAIQSEGQEQVGEIDPVQGGLQTDQEHTTEADRHEAKTQLLQEEVRPRSAGGDSKSKENVDGRRKTEGQAETCQTGRTS